MRSRLYRLIGVAACGATLGLVPLAAVAGATDGSPPDTTTDTTLPAPVVAESSTFTMPLFGAPLTIDVSTDPGGALASVALNPADGYTAVKDRANRVAFVNADGTATVRVTAGRKGDQVTVRGSALADVLGPGGWSGDVFGSGTTTTVGFAVADRGDGTPDIVDVTSSDPSATVGATDHHSSGRGSWARASVVFTDGAQRRVLTISASVATGHDGATRASVSATLSGTRGVPQAAADAAGAHTWSGLLCDGSAATVQYTVAEDGTVSGVTATPDGATVGDKRGATVVRFATGERVVIHVREHDGQITVNAGTAFRCDSADPSVNTPIDTTIPGGWDGDHRGHDGDGQRGDGHGKGGFDGRGDDSGGRGQGGDPSTGTGGHDGHGGGRDGSTGSWGSGGRDGSRGS